MKEDLRILYWLRIGLTATLALIFIWAGYVSLEFTPIARYMPFAIAAAGAFFAGFHLLRDIYWTRHSPEVITEEMSAAIANQGGDMTEVAGGALRAGIYLLAFVAYGFLIFLVGILAASLLFISAFMLVVARLNIYWSLAAAVVTVLALMGLQNLLHLRWPTSIWTLL